MAEETIYDVIIAGAGPAGMTAAVYTSRAGLKYTHASAWDAWRANGEYGRRGKLPWF